MGILSSIGSAIKSAVSKVKSAVSSIGSAISGGSSSSGSTTSSGGGSSSSGGGSSMGSGGGTYNSSSGTYTDSSGQGFSTATQPEGSIATGEGSSSNQEMSQQSDQGFSSANQSIAQTPAKITGQNEDGSYTYTSQDGSTFFVDANGVESIMHSGAVSGLNIGSPVITDQGFGVFAESYWNNIKTSSNTQALTLATGIAGFARALIGKGVTIASGQVLQGTAGKAAGGKIIQTTLTPQAPAFVVNTKTAGLTAKYLTKLTKGLKNPLLALGLISTVAYTSLFWAPNEKGDALTTLSIVQRTAAQNGDEEMVSQIDELIQETNDIAASIPVLGFIQAEKAKFEAAAIASETYKRDAEKTVQDAADKVEADEAKAASDAQIYGTVDEQGNYVLSPTELAKRKEAEEYYAGIEKEKQFEYEDGKKTTEPVSQEEADNLLAEAIRKKKAGEPLTPEEQALLDKWNNYGQSELGFGLLK